MTSYDISIVFNAAYSIILQNRYIVLYIIYIYICMIEIDIYVLAAFTTLSLITLFLQK